MTRVKVGNQGSALCETKFLRQESQRTTHTWNTCMHNMKRVAAHASQLVFDERPVSKANIERPRNKFEAIAFNLSLNFKDSSHERSQISSICVINTARYSSMNILYDQRLYYLLYNYYCIVDIIIMSP